MPDHKILIIEDDPILNDQLAHLLRDKGYAVDQCFDGDEGLSHALKQQHQPTVHKTLQQLCLMGLLINEKTATGSMLYKKNAVVSELSIRSDKLMTTIANYLSTLQLLLPNRQIN